MATLRRYKFFVRFRKPVLPIKHPRRFDFAIKGPDTTMVPPYPMYTVTVYHLPVDVVWPPSMSDHGPVRPENPFSDSESTEPSRNLLP